MNLKEKKRRSRLGEIIEIDPNINMEEEFGTWWTKVKPDEYEESFKSAVKNSYYAGAGNMGFIMSQLAKNKSKDGGAIVDRLFNEINDYFLSLIGVVEAAHKEEYKDKK